MTVRARARPVMRRVRGELRHPVTLVRRQHWELLLRCRRELKHGESELAVVASLADPARCFVDVGANGGVYSGIAMPHFRSVVAVEANPGLAERLARSLGPAATVVSFALSDVTGEALLWMPTHDGRDVDSRASLQESANPGFGLRPVEVTMTTLDDLPLERVAVIKIDVEGHELAVLRGAQRTLARDRPVCIVESEERHNADGVRDVMAFFAERGWSCWFLHRGEWCPGASFAVSRLQDVSQIKVVGDAKSEDYVNNFVFVPNERADLLGRMGIA